MRAKADKADGECGISWRKEKQMVDPIGQGFDREEGGWCIVLAPHCPFFWFSKYNWTAFAPWPVSREEEWGRMVPSLKKGMS
jgi:hypothetical protein